jgi:hypothetical protein
MDQGLNAKQRILQLEHVSYELCMLENYADYAASNMFLNHPIIFLDFPLIIGNYFVSLFQEISLLSRLEHENIVQYFGTDKVLKVMKFISRIKL